MPFSAAEKQRRYREANKDKIADYQRRYREANKAELADYRRRYREANKAELADYQRRYREANKAEIAEKQRRYYEANKAELAEKKRRYREANKAEIAEKQVSSLAVARLRAIKAGITSAPRSGDADREIGFALGFDQLSGAFLPVPIGRPLPAKMRSLAIFRFCPEPPSWSVSLPMLTAPAWPTSPPRRSRLDARSLRCNHG